MRYLLVILTHLAYRAATKKRDVSNVLKARGKHALGDVNFSVLALDGVTSL